MGSVLPLGSAGFSPLPIVRPDPLTIKAWVLKAREKSHGASGSDGTWCVLVVTHVYF